MAGGRPRGERGHAGVDVAALLVERAGGSGALVDHPGDGVAPFWTAYGIEPSGASLVRPDGYVGWRQGAMARTGRSGWAPPGGDPRPERRAGGRGAVLLLTPVRGGAGLPPAAGARAGARVVHGRVRVEGSMTTDRTAQFRALHESGTFVMPNPWDVGSARILASLGFPALATTVIERSAAADRRRRMDE